MKIISFGELSIYLIYPFFIPISRLIINKGRGLFQVKASSEYPVVSIVLMFLSEIIGGCLYFVKSCVFNRAKRHQSTKSQPQI